MFLSQALQTFLPPPRGAVSANGSSIVIQIEGYTGAYGLFVERTDGGFTASRSNFNGTYVPQGWNTFTDPAVTPGVKYTYRTYFFRLGVIPEPPTVPGVAAYYTMVAGSNAVSSPYAEACANSRPCSGFQPVLGSGGDPCADEGTKADPVLLSTGGESYDPRADLDIYNSVGPRVKFIRNYRSHQALLNQSSPGFTAGWSHNYDVRITTDSLPAWNTVSLVYSSGAKEALTPETSGGSPNGSFQEPSGAPYFVEGSPSGTPGVWNWFRVTFHDRTEWLFLPKNDYEFRLTKITVRTGQYLELTYDANDRLSEIRNQAGASLLWLGYNGVGQLVSANSGLGHSIYYTYNTVGSENIPVLSGRYMITPTADPTFTLAATYGYQVVDHQPVLQTVQVPSPTGTGQSTTTIATNSANLKVSSITDANGNQTVFTYAPTSALVETKNSSGTLVASVTHKFDTLGRDTGIIDAAGNSTSIEYQSSTNPLRPTRITDRDGRVLLMTYDNFGNLTSKTTPRGVVTTWTYDYSAFALGQLTSVVTGTGSPTTYTYTAQGLVQTVSVPTPTGTGTATTTYTYDSLGNITSLSQPGTTAGTTATTNWSYTTDGNYTQSAKVGQVIRATDPSGKVMRARYNPSGDLTQHWDDLGNQTDLTYSAIGRVSEILYPATGQTGTGRSKLVMSYLNNEGPDVTRTLKNESGATVQTLSVTRGPEGEVLGQSGGSNASNQTYDAAYRLKTLTDPLGRTTTYSYNSRGWLTSIAMPGGDTETVTGFTNEGHVTSRTNPNGQVINYSYADPDGLLTSIQVPTAPSENVTCTYDARGRLAQRTDGQGTYLATFGRNGELLTETTTYVGLPSKTTTFNYAANGNLTSVFTPAGTFAFGWDLAGKMTSLTNPQGEVTSYLYTNNSNVATQIMANGLRTDWTYDAGEEVTSITTQTAFQVIRAQFTAMQYDGQANLLSSQLSVPGNPSYGGAATATYNNIGELTNWTTTRGGSINQSFAADANGNLTTLRGVTKQHNVRNQLVGSGFAYDYSGNATTWRGTAAIYTSDNRLKTWGTYGAGIRADGLRAWRQSNNGAKTYFIYVGSQPVCELGPTGDVIAINTFGPAGLVSRRVGSSTTYYVFDERGNTLLRTDAAGNVLTTHSTDAYGLTTSSGGAGNDPFAGFSAQVGGMTESSVGLVILGHRAYDPTEGRFLSRDPLSVAAGLNFYRYCSNNPVNHVDPLGLMDDLYDYAAAGAQAGYSAQSGLGTFYAEWMNLTTAVADTFGGQSVKTLSTASGGAYGKGDYAVAAGYGAATLGLIALESFTWGRTGAMVRAPLTGVKAAETEFSHFIGEATMRKNPVWYKIFSPERTIFNGRVVSVTEHALTDAYRWRFLPKAMKEALVKGYGVTRSYFNRLPDPLRFLSFYPGLNLFEKLSVNPCP